MRNWSSSRNLRHCRRKPFACSESTTPVPSKASGFFDSSLENQYFTFGARSKFGLDEGPQSQLFLHQKLSAWKDGWDAAIKVIPNQFKPDHHVPSSVRLCLAQLSVDVRWRLHSPAPGLGRTSVALSGGPANHFAPIDRNTRGSRFAGEAASRRLRAQAWHRSG